MNEEKKYLAKIGKRGGKAGTGKSKKRGNSNYYRELALKRHGKRSRENV